MPSTKPINPVQAIPDVVEALQRVHAVMDGGGPDSALRHLVRLRASQINGCAHCVKMHTREAREDGETSQRLDRLVVWEHVSDFSPEERVALAWTEALTTLDRKTDYAALRARLREHLGDAEIAALTAEVAMINLWNRIQVSNQ